MLHIAEQYAGLLPDDAKAKSRAISWIFAALNTIEPPILDLSIAKVVENDKAWSEQRLPLVKDRIRNKLKQLSAYLCEKSWLEDEFSVGDLMMISVLLRLRASGILLEFPNLDDYVTRGESRPAYQRAFAAQLAINAP